MVFAKIGVFIVFTLVAIGILKYTYQIVQIFGKMSWAERRLGTGGTFTMWKLIAIGLIVGSLIYLTSAAW